MRHETLYLDEFLRGELVPADEARVRAHLEACPACADEAAWLKGLRGLTARFEVEPPSEVWAALEARLLAIPAADPQAAARPARRTRPLPFPAVAFMPWARAAAMLLFGLLLGYGIWGRQPAGVSDQMAMQGAAPTSAGIELASAPAGSAGGAGAQGDPARAMEAAYFSRVEAALVTFVTGTSEGSPASVPGGTLQGLLRLTANKKAESRAANDARMTGLYGKIESVLMEIERLGRNQDLSGARHAVTVIEEQGLLSTLQRFKIGVED